ncbi:MAG: phosphoribosylaminoimidazolesuccinocarboxamide synthase [Burkholderiaceae bacterium]
MPPQTLFESRLTSLPLIGRGKVRDIYAVGSDHLLLIASDRLSAFDVVMTEPIPGKGELLTRMALFWFAELADLVPNHLTGQDPESVVTAAERDQVRGRSMLVKRLKPIPVEAVVRGYLAGSAWLEYQKLQSVCGVRLPGGLRNAARLETPIFTPATKAVSGGHDENISVPAVRELIGFDLAQRLEAVALSLYARAAPIALDKGIIIADTKFEFGLDSNNVLTLMDEVLTPDSSRFWPVNSYAEGSNPPSFDKQIVRDWLESVRPYGKAWDKCSPAPSLPAEIIQATAARYREALLHLAQ